MCSISQHEENGPLLFDSLENCFCRCRKEIVQSYTITSEMAGYGRRQMPKNILVIALPIVASEILFIFWKAHLGEHLGLRSFVEAVFIAIVGAVLAELWEIGKNYPYTLVFSDDSIRVVYPNRESLLRRDELKSVREIQGNAFRVAGLEISKYGRFGTRFWGGILIPKALPEYESVRSLILSWRSTTGI